MNQARFQKQQREKARKEKAAAKEARREERRSAEGSADDPVDAADQDVVLAELADLHQRYEAGQVEFEEFLEAKEELTARLDIR
jgi:hypothetical protein